jgi:GNAT superfamily N-acetyltransferase
MTQNDLQIKTFDLRNASDHEYAAAHIFANRLRAEQLPDDPPIPLDEIILGWRSIPPFQHIPTWVIWRTDGSQIVARGHVSWLETEENKHLVQFRIQVLPEYRRQGLARQLLALIAEVTHRENRRLMITETSERVPAGAAFMERLGARKGLAAHTNQLKIAELNRDLIHQWQVRAQERASDFELGFWDGPYPEEDIEAIAALIQVMNTAPRDNLEVEDVRFTPAQVREIEKSIFTRGTHRWTVYVREKTTGKFAGFSALVTS